MKRTTFALAFCLLLAQPAAAVPVGASLSASGVRAVGPDPGSVSGPLTFFSLADLPESAASSPTVPPFFLEAAQVRLERVHADVSAWTDTPLASVTPGARSNETLHMQARMEETSNRQGFYLQVYPPRDYADTPPIATVERGCFRVGSVDSHKGDTIETKPHVGARIITADISRTLLARACPDGESGTVVRVSGTFMVHLWQIDALLTEAGGDSQTVESGHLASNPNMEGLAVGAGRSQEVYATVYDGVFEIPFTADAELYIRSLTGSLDGMLVVEEATGRIDTGTDPVYVDGKDVRVRGGPMLFTAQGHGRNPMSMSLDGGWKEAHVGDGGLHLVAGNGAAEAAAAPALLAVLALGALAAARRSRLA